jgi:hypothetical protein
MNDHWAGFSGWEYALHLAGLSQRTGGDQAASRSQKQRFGRNRQMVTGNGFSDSAPGAVKHLG